MAQVSPVSGVNWDKLLDEAEYVGFDTENNGHLQLFDDGVRINGFSICVKSNGEYIAEYFPCNHIRGTNYRRDYWEPILRKVLTKKVIAHNVKFDMRSARMLLGELIDRPLDYFFDTTRLCHMVNEEAMGLEDGPRKAWSLENCCQLFGIPGKAKSPLFLALLTVYGWNGISPAEIREYAEADAVAVYRLFEKVTYILGKEPDADNIHYWKNIEMPNFKVLYDMNTLGVKVDLEKCKEWEEKCERELYNLREELGFDPAKPTQLKPVIYDTLGLPVIYGKRKVAGGGFKETPTLDSKAMERYDIMLERLGNPIAKKIIAYRGWSKALSSYYRPYQDWVCPDGRIRPDFASHGTVNGRFACSKPNLQQIPKDSENKPWVKDVKSCFIPEQGYELWEFDYSQLELRMGAAFGNDRKLLEILKDPNRDIFSEIAAEMGWERFICKTFVYSIDYGAGPQRVSDIFGVDKRRAQELIEEFYEAYPGLGAANQRAKLEAEQTGKVRLWSGRFRHFSRRKDSFKAFNSKIQGGSADLVKDRMNAIKRELPEVRMLLQVHDSLWFELPTGRVEEYKVAIKSIMENPFPGEDRVKFFVDGHRVGGMAL